MLVEFLDDHQHRFGMRNETHQVDSLVWRTYRLARASSGLPLPEMR